MLDKISQGIFARSGDINGLSQSCFEMKIKIEIIGYTFESSIFPCSKLLKKMKSNNDEA